MKTLGLGTCIIGIVAAMALLDPESGFGIWREMRADLSASTLRVERLEAENEAIRREIQTLEREPAALDRAIREELDLVLPGEVVVRFVERGIVPKPAGRARSGPLGQRSHSADGQRHRENP